MTLNPITLILAAGFSMISPSHTANETYNPDITPGQWKLVRNTGGVQTFYRWTTNDHGVSFRERKGEMNVSCSLQEAVHLISDAKSTPKWMSSIDKIYDLEHISKNEWYTYTLFNIPWPLNNRDLVSLNKLTAYADQGLVVIDITCKDKYVPLNKGTMRLTEYKANWRLTQTGEKNTRIIFTAASSAPPSLPRYIQDPIIEKIFHNNLVRLKEMLGT